MTPRWTSFFFSFFCPTLRNCGHNIILRLCCFRFRALRGSSTAMRGTCLACDPLESPENKKGKKKEKKKGSTNDQIYVPVVTELTKRNPTRAASAPVSIRPRRRSGTSHFRTSRCRAARWGSATVWSGTPLRGRKHTT